MKRKRAYLSLKVPRDRTHDRTHDRNGMSYLS